MKEQEITVTVEFEDGDLWALRGRMSFGDGPVPPARKRHIGVRWVDKKAQMIEIEADDEYVDILRDLAAIRDVGDGHWDGTHTLYVDSRYNGEDVLTFIENINAGMTDDE